MSFQHIEHILIQEVDEVFMEMDEVSMDDVQISNGLSFARIEFPTYF
jgi:hypothetical protein